MLSILFIYILIVSPAYSYYIIVEPNMIDCYHERAAAGAKLGFSFEVMGESVNDIDISIKDPKKEIVHSELTVDSGKYTIEAGSDGDYEFCFHNRVSQGQRRYLMFNIDETKARKDNLGDDTDEKKIAVMVRNLHMAALNSKHEASYLVQRDKIHQKISESTNTTIAKWIFFEAFLLLSISLAQVWYVRRYFETRRKV